MSDWHYVMTTDDGGEDHITLYSNLERATKTFTNLTLHPYDYKRITMGKCVFMGNGVLKQATIKRTFDIEERTQ